MTANWVGAAATQMARAVRHGEAAATQVVADHIDYAFAASAGGILRVLRASEAIAEAELVDEQSDLRHLLLAGVPVVVSDRTPVAGVPTLAGAAVCDHEVVRRLRGAGAIVLGVVATVPGPATAVAAGLAPLALGAGPLAPGVVELGSAQPVAGCDDVRVFATTVADAAAGFAALTGRDLAPSAGRLRIGVVLQGPLAARRIVRYAARLFVRAGHDAVWARNPGREYAFGKAFDLMLAGEPGESRRRGWGRDYTTLRVPIASTGDSQVWVSLAGPPGSERALLAAGALLERVSPWRTRAVRATESVSPPLAHATIGA